MQPSLKFVAIRSDAYALQVSLQWGASGKLARSVISLEGAWEQVWMKTRTISDGREGQSSSRRHLVHCCNGDELLRALNAGVRFRYLWSSRLVAMDAGIVLYSEKRRRLHSATLCRRMQGDAKKKVGVFRLFSRYFSFLCIVLFVGKGWVNKKLKYSTVANYPWNWWIFVETIKPSPLNAFCIKRSRSQKLCKNQKRDVSVEFPKQIFKIVISL